MQEECLQNNMDLMETPYEKFTYSGQDNYSTGSVSGFDSLDSSMSLDNSMWYDIANQPQYYLNSSYAHPVTRYSADVSSSISSNSGYRLSNYTPNCSDIRDGAMFNYPMEHDPNETRPSSTLSSQAPISPVAPPSFNESHDAATRKKTSTGNPNLFQGMYPPLSVSSEYQNKNNTHFGHRPPLLPPNSCGPYSENSVKVEAPPDPSVAASLINAIVNQEGEKVNKQKKKISRDGECTPISQHYTPPSMQPNQYAPVNQYDPFRPQFSANRKWTLLSRSRPHENPAEGKLNMASRKIDRVQLEFKFSHGEVKKFYLCNFCGKDNYVWVNYKNFVHQHVPRHHPEECVHCDFCDSLVYKEHFDLHESKCRVRVPKCRKK